MILFNQTDIYLMNLFYLNLFDRTDRQSNILAWQIHLFDQIDLVNQIDQKDMFH